jgi:hypothetical protein
MAGGRDRAAECNFMTARPLIGWAFHLFVENMYLPLQEQKDIYGGFYLVIQLGFVFTLYSLQLHQND